MLLRLLEKRKGPLLSTLLTPCHAFLLTAVCAVVVVAAAHPRGVGRVNQCLQSAPGECFGEEGGHHLLLRRLETPRCDYNV